MINGEHAMKEQHYAAQQCTQGYPEPARDQSSAALLSMVQHLNVGLSEAAEALEGVANRLGLPHVPQAVEAAAGGRTKGDGWVQEVDAVLMDCAGGVAAIQYTIQRLRQFI